jgi:hypothetical protein
MNVYRIKESSPCSFRGAVSASFILHQNYSLTQFSLQTRALQMLTNGIIQQGNIFI